MGPSSSTDHHLAEPRWLTDCSNQHFRSVGLSPGPSQPEDAGLDVTDLQGLVIFRHTT